MAVLDIIVLLLVGAAAIGGFLRGFSQEIRSFAAWVLAIVAIRTLHDDLTGALLGAIGSPEGAALLALSLLLLIPYAAMKLIVRRAAQAGGSAALNPLDRVLGFGFGALKGVMIVVIGFSLLVLGYDRVWGAAGRPSWLTQARTYQFADASSRALVEILHQRRSRLEGGAAPDPAA